MLSVVLGTILFAILMFANRLLFKKRGRIPLTRWAEAAGLSFLAGIVNYVSPNLKGSPGAILCLLGIAAAYMWLCYSWNEGSEWKEFVPYAIVALLLYFPAESAVWAVAPMVASLGWRSLLTFLPEVAMIGSIAYMAWRLLDFHHERFLKMEDERRANRYRIAKIVVIVLMIILLILMAAFGVSWDGFGGEPQVAEEEVVVDNGDVSDMDVTWYRFYHYDLLGDGDENLEDDFNFGKPAYPDGTAMQAKEEHFKRVEEDPALGCATFATFDVRLGTDFLMPGQHYDQDWSDGYWTTLINERIQYYMANPSSYDVAVERWETFVNKYANVTLSYQKGLTDQMYMVSLTSSSELEPPEVIVCYTDQPDGHVLNYEFKIKGNLFVVPFRTECGLQPVNVATVMKETPQANPVKKTSSSKPASTKPSSSSSSSSGSGSSSSGSTVSGSGSSSSTVSNSGSSIRDRKDPVGDPVNNGSADKGGGQNKPSDGAGEYQPIDPRTETYTGPEEDNHHGYSDPATVTPPSPPVVKEHQQEEREKAIVDHEDKMDYEPDPVTTRGATKGIDPTPVAGGAGGFTPDD